MIAKIAETAETAKPTTSEGGDSAHVCHAPSGHHFPSCAQHFQQFFPPGVALA